MRILSFLLIVIGLTAASFAHHGFTGEYDFSRPIYLRGTVTKARHGFPHAQFVVDVPADLALPKDLDGLRAIEDVEERETLKRLVLPAKRGPIDILIEPVMTQTLVKRGIPAVGDQVQVIAYERTSDDAYKGELRVMLLRVGNETFTAPVRSYHKEKGQ